MRTKFFFLPLGAMLLGACFVSPKDDVDTAATPAPAHAAEPARAGNVAVRFPILFDYRQVLAAQDISGLREGTHSFELDLYAPTRVGWTPEAERVVRDGIRVLHVDTRKPASVRVTFGPEEKEGARRVQVDMDLTEAGSWVVMIGGGLVAAHADPELLAHYTVRDPRTLRPSGDYEFFHPSLMLRTVGHCNHVREVITKVDETGTLSTVELRFSEPIEPGAIAEGMSLGFTDSERRRGTRVRVESVSVRDDVVELKIPVLRDKTGMLDIPLARIRNFAGRFRDGLSCDQADGSIDVGYVFRGQENGDHVVAPLLEAASRALGEEKK